MNSNEILSPEALQQVEYRLQADKRQYWDALNKLAVERDVCYPNLGSAIEKAESELKFRRSIPRSARIALEKLRDWTQEKLFAWDRALSTIEVGGEVRLLAALRNLVQSCTVTIDNLDRVPARLERLIETFKSPKIGNFTADSVARCDWDELASLLSRPGSFDGVLESFKARQKEIEGLESVVQRAIESGQFSRRSGAKTPKRFEELEQIQVRGAFDPRAPRR